MKTSTLVYNRNEVTGYIFTQIIITKTTTYSIDVCSLKSLPKCASCLYGKFHEGAVILKGKVVSIKGVIYEKEKVQFNILPGK